MERQVKERLIGAAVLVAAAVVLVPEIFSGSAVRTAPTEYASSAAAHATEQTDSSTSSGQLKTYRIQLQEGSAPPSPATELPPAVPAHEEVLASSSASSDVSSASSSSSSAAPSKPVGKPQGLAASSSAPSKAPEPKATPVSAPAKPVSNNGKGWVVQIGSFGTDAKARQIVGSLKAHDFPAYSGAITVNGKTLYRVRVGPLGERSAADALLKKLKGGYPDASVLPAG